MPDRNLGRGKRVLPTDAPSGKHPRWGRSASDTEMETHHWTSYRHLRCQRFLWSPRRSLTAVRAGQKPLRLVRCGCCTLLLHNVTGNPQRPLTPRHLLLELTCEKIPIKRR
jgi:hypothetical protein